ncbi:hypothetical protein [Reichenbachiella sp.]|uniref:hypothetical protein n=1 Tax=Reichenbachiella sp. TaxID=2184521 RepID=UPI003B59442E
MADSNRQKYLLLLLVGCFGVLTKNGFMLVAPGVALVLLNKERNKKGLLKALGYGLALYLVHFWLTRYFSNSDVHQVLGGSSFRSLGAHYLNVITAWFLPLKLDFHIRLVAVLGIWAVGFLFGQPIKWNRDRQLINLLILFFCYVILRSYYSRIDYHESERYLSILFPAFLLFVALFCDRILRNLKAVNLIRLRNLVYASLLFWFIYSAIRTIYNDVLWHQVRQSI